MSLSLGGKREGGPSLGVLHDLLGRPFPSDSASSGTEAASAPSGISETAPASMTTLAANRGQPARSGESGAAATVPLPFERHRTFFDQYYDPVTERAKAYGVDPGLVLGIAGESGFGTAGTARRTHDVFGMTGGSTKHMTRALSPANNAQQFFDRYGDQIRGAGSDVNRFLNGLEGLDAAGRPVPGWKRYNSADPDWVKKRQREISMIQRELPGYAAARPK